MTSEEGDSRRPTTNEQDRTLRERLIAGYLVYAAEDVALAAEWRAADDEAWLEAVPT